MSRLTPSDPTIETWDRIWQTYSTLQESSTPRLVETLARLDLAGKRVCEVGCGTGKDSLSLASRGAQLVSVDFSRQALELVRQKAGAGLFPYLVAGDTLKLPFRDETFDVLFHQGLLEHFREPLAVLGEQARVLKPGGYLLVDVPQRFNWYAVKKRREIARGTWFAGWETDFSYPALCRLLRKAGFTPVESYAYGFYPPPLWLARHLHQVGKGRFARPLMPAGLGRLYERAWQWWERSALARYALVCIGVLSRKARVAGTSGS